MEDNFMIAPTPEKENKVVDESQLDLKASVAQNLR